MLQGTSNRYSEETPRNFPPESGLRNSIQLGTRGNNESSIEMIKSENSLPYDSMGGAGNFLLPTCNFPPEINCNLRITGDLEENNGLINQQEVDTQSNLTEALHSVNPSEDLPEKNNIAEDVSSISINFNNTDFSERDLF